MKVLSIRQPWAWLIIRPDIVDPSTRIASLGRDLKDYENRDWPTRFRGRFLIHAGKGMTRDEYEDALDSAMTAVRGVIPTFPAFQDLPRGGIVGEAEIIDCVDTNTLDAKGERYPSPWLFGRFGFKLANAKPLPFFPCRGALGFWDAPAEAAVEPRKGGEEG